MKILCTTSFTKQAQFKIQYFLLLLIIIKYNSTRNSIFLVIIELNLI